MRNGKSVAANSLFIAFSGISKRAAMAADVSAMQSACHAGLAGKQRSDQSALSLSLQLRARQSAESAAACKSDKEDGMDVVIERRRKMRTRLRVRPVCLEVPAAMQYAVKTDTYTRDSVVLPADRRQP
jgi:hypothetical protein